MKKEKILIIFGVVIVIVLAVVLAFLFNKKETITYNVSFKVDEEIFAEQTVNEGEQVQKPIDPVKTGYVFEAWIYNNEPYDFSLDVTSDIILIAKWIKVEEEVETFVVKFDSDGGTTIANQVVENGNKATKPTDPVKTGYTFEGWMLDDSAYNFELAVNGDITLVAKWAQVKETKYTVTFNSNGGSSVSSQSIVKGKKATKPTDPTKNGYIFSEWTLDGNAYNFSSSVNSNITLVAKWTKIEAPTLVSAIGGWTKQEQYCKVDIALSGYYATPGATDKIDGWELYEKNSNGYTLINSVKIDEAMPDVTVEIGKSKTFVARVYVLNKAGTKVYSEYSNEYVMDNSKVEAPTLVSAIGGWTKQEQYCRVDIVLSGYYATPGATDKIDGWELYEKNSNGYTLINSVKIDEAMPDVTVEIGKSKTFVARAYVLNKAGTKVYSEYSNEYVMDNSKVEAPTLVSAIGGWTKQEQYCRVDIVLSGYYATPGATDKIDGWELYEKNSNGYTLINSVKIDEAMPDVTVEIGKSKTFVARVYVLNKAGAKVYSEYSNEYVIGNSSVEE